MAANKGNYLRNALVNWIFRGASAPSVSAAWVALYTTNQTAADGGTEVTGNNYSRVQIERTSSGWSAASSGVTSNLKAITFPIPTDAWGTIRSVGVKDSSAAGNLLYWSNLASPLTISDTTTAPNIPIGDFDVEEL